MLTAAPGNFNHYCPAKPENSGVAPFQIIRSTIVRQEQGQIFVKKTTFFRVDTLIAAVQNSRKSSNRAPQYFPRKSLDDTRKSPLSMQKD